MAGEPTPQATPGGPAVAAQADAGKLHLDELVKERAEALTNKQLGELKAKWQEQVKGEFQSQLEQMQTKLQEYEDRDKSEIEKAQDAATKADARVQELQSELFKSRWDSQVAGALHQANLAGTSVLPQFVQAPQLTGKETLEDLAAKAQEVVTAAYDAQSQTLTAAGYTPRAQPPGHMPGVGPRVTAGQNVIPVQVGGPATQKPAGPVDRGESGAWKMVKGAMAGGQPMPEGVPRPIPEGERVRPIPPQGR